MTKVAVWGKAILVGLDTALQWVNLPYESRSASIDCLNDQISPNADSMMTALPKPISDQFGPLLGRRLQGHGAG